MVKIKIKIHYYTVVGQILKIIGNTKELGIWKDGVEMVYKENGFWSTELEINKFPFEYKFQIYNNNTGEVVWENCYNRICYFCDEVDEIKIKCTWNSAEETFYKFIKNKIPLQDGDKLFSLLDMIKQKSVEGKKMICVVKKCINSGK